MRADSGALPWVLIAIVGITTARSLFLYLHQVTAARIVMRMVTDIQKAAFAHLINADFARLTRETTGHLVSRLTNDLTFIQQAAPCRSAASAAACARWRAAPRASSAT
jgi:subfamily B ATP-binding cassette protein MsbA